MNIDSNRNHGSNDPGPKRRGVVFLRHFFLRTKLSRDIVIAAPFMRNLVVGSPRTWRVERHLVPVAVLTTLSLAWLLLGYSTGC